MASLAAASTENQLVVIMSEARMASVPGQTSVAELRLQQAASPNSLQAFFNTQTASKLNNRSRRIAPIT